MCCVELSHAAAGDEADTGKAGLLRHPLEESRASTRDEHATPVRIGLASLRARHLAKHPLSVIAASRQPRLITTRRSGLRQSAPGSDESLLTMRTTSPEARQREASTDDHDDQRLPDDHRVGQHRPQHSRRCRASVNRRSTSRREPRYSSRNSSGIFAWISGGSDAKSVAQVWRQLAHFSVMTVKLFMRRMLPTC